VRKPATAGVTLIELLLAITLVSALSVGMLMALRVGLNAMDKTNSRLYGNRRSAGLQLMLEQQISGIIAVRGDCPVSGGGLSSIPFFHGDPQAMRLVTAFSMKEGWRGYPRVVELQVVPRESGGVRLIGTEHLYYGPASLAPFCRDGKFLPVQHDARSVVLADDLAFCRFLFREPKTDGAWLPVWRNDLLPGAIRVELAPLKIDPAGIPQQSITVPIRVTRWLTGPYHDQQ
jgi:hypothetical protein